MAYIDSQIDWCPLVAIKTKPIKEKSTFETKKEIISLLAKLEELEDKFYKPRIKE